MDPIQVFTDWAGWPVLFALCLLAAPLVAWVIRSRFDVLRERNEGLVEQIAGLKDQIANLKENTPDLLAERLAARHRLLSGELERLHSDQAASQQLTEQKEAELASVKSEIELLGVQLEAAQELVQTVRDSGLLCPICGAPLATREYHSFPVEYQGYELDDEHELIRYECGFSTHNGKVETECPNSASGTRFAPR